MLLSDLTWTCHVCGRERPDAAISVYTTDVSAEHGLPPGTARNNVRYCNDDPDCTERAKTLRFFPPERFKEGLVDRFGEEAVSEARREVARLLLGFLEDRVTVQELAQTELGCAILLGLSDPSKITDGP